MTQPLPANGNNNETHSAPETNTLELKLGRAELALHGDDFILEDHELGLIGVFDGMGGHADGALASQTAAEAVQEYYRAHDSQPLGGIEDVVETMRRALQHADGAIGRLNQGKRGKEAMGTTATVVKFVNDPDGDPMIVYGQVGDSRLYLDRAGELRQLTVDETA